MVVLGKIRGSWKVVFVFVMLNTKLSCELRGWMGEQTRVGRG